MRMCIVGMFPNKSIGPPPTTLHLTTPNYTPVMPNIHSAPTKWSLICNRAKNLQFTSSTEALNCTQLQPDMLNMGVSAETCWKKKKNMSRYTNCTAPRKVIKTFI